MGGAMLSNPGSLSRLTEGFAGKTLFAAEGTAVGGPTTTTIHTVTAGKTFWLIGCGLNIYSTTTDLYCKLVKNPGARPLIWLKGAICVGRTTDAQTIVVTYPHPIPFAGGDTMQVYASANGIKGFGWVQGWEQ